MAIGLKNKPNIVPVSGDFPDGRIKDNTGLNDGTPVNQLVYDDFHQFFAKIMRDSSTTPNNTPDNVTNGFQYVDALNLSVKLFDNEFGWETTSFALAAGFSTDATYPLEVRKIGDKVEWRGAISISSPGVASGSVVLSGFSAAIRPLNIDKYLAVGINQAGDRHAALEFKEGSGATVNIHHNDASSDLTIFFDGISYFV